VKQPTNCSRLSRKRRRRRGPVPLSLAALLLCVVVVVWLFCSGGMWTIAHPSSAGPSWRPSIKDEETTRTSKSPIHFCLCRDIYHGDVIEISIHPVCVPCPPPPSVCLSFSSRKMTTPVENRYVEMGEAPEIIRWEPKKKNIYLFGKRNCWQKLEQFRFFSFLPNHPALRFLFLFYGLGCYCWTAHESLVYFDQIKSSILKWW
jgi:hypothetical protein